ncbi:MULTISPECIES: CHAD domain-containing protein [unclassified Synechococcus]|uniref:CHAD domain-containing protein n=1 Tax=unclassified Synechococcus TaxID=2626047 RepID=UPI0021A53B50|nr:MULTISPECIES: CHAD domain-containing protein [unclassified Synechococcus]MCT0213973.1 CHAD domain-containing protein [Synechococcus sp. CS-1326]MCT0233549.1 CHAD domain-containing protein [Synechococcus sp. CS-1327]
MLDLSAPLLSSGDYARELIQRQTRRLGKLQAEVLADQDPEALHQLRVSLRRLRTALNQFGAALVIPDAISDRRIARVAGRTGLTRDLDVMRARITSTWLPMLPGAEQKALKPVLKQLDRDRQVAFDGLAASLREGPYLKLLARLHKWQQSPRFTAIGQRPLRGWLFEWLAQSIGALFLQAGWSAVDPHDGALHDLRKTIKGVRYSLEVLEPFACPALGDWVADLRKAQDCLGDLHDLQVLSEALSDQLERDLAKAVPTLHQAIELQQAERWGQWLSFAELLLSDTRRQALKTSLIEAA